jgi:predicted alpha/beta hydrolase
MVSPRPREITLRTADGHSLAASAWEPEREPPGAVLITSATGVKRGFYAPFASFLAERGLLVLSFDYRGVGGSRPRSLAMYDARMRDWGQQDAEAALQWLLARTPHVALVGHSFGGQALGLMPGAPRLRAALLVAAQSGYWRHWRGVHRLGLWALWHVLIPGLCTACGYFPGRVLGSAQDLPSGVAREWARWGRFPGHVADDEGGALAAGFAGLTLPIRAYSFADDNFAPAAAVDGLLRLYAAAAREHVHLDPRDLGRPIGHWGFFREKSREPLWLDAAGWLEAQLGGPGSRGAGRTG